MLNSWTSCLSESGSHPLVQHAAKRLQGWSIAPAFAAHQVERPFQAQTGNRQHGHSTRGAFGAHRQPRHDGEADSFSHNALDRLGVRPKRVSMKRA
jgi:hypothetical protein